MSNSNKHLTYAEVANSSCTTATTPKATTTSTLSSKEAKAGGITSTDTSKKLPVFPKPPPQPKQYKTQGTSPIQSTTSSKRKGSEDSWLQPKKIKVDEFGHEILSEEEASTKSVFWQNKAATTEFEYIPPAPKKKKMIDEFMDYCKQHKIVDEHCLKQRPLEEYEEWVKHPRFTFDSMKVFKAVRSLNINHSMTEHFKKLSEGEMQRVYNHRGEKLETLLCGHHGWSERYYWMFLINLVKVVHMRNGKKNCLLLQGASNCGKTQICKSFCDAYFPNLYTMPSTDLSSSFMWGPCMDSPLILAEEVTGDLAHLDQLKNILEGTDTTIDVKYEKNARLIGTPIFITTNNCLYKCKPSEAAAFNNRCVHYYLAKPIPDNSNELVPLTKLDWDYALTKAYDKFGLGKLIEAGKMDRFKRQQKLQNELKMDEADVHISVSTAIFMFDYIINGGVDDFEDEEPSDEIKQFDICTRFIEEYDNYVSKKKFNPYKVADMFSLYHSDTEFKGRALIDLQRFFNWAKTYHELTQTLLMEHMIK